VSDRSRGDRVAIAIVLALVGAYKSILSPLFAGCCRFEPSCSDYMIQAVSTHGALRGVWLGLRRIARCHPFGRFGPDPCPPAIRTDHNGHA
jgi:putative membrane protein insertion efficiency factor